MSENAAHRQNDDADEQNENAAENHCLILGTAGHIDHGKSTLIQALTGTDPDRLAEEKRRGITIELGFAQLELPGGRHMGVVDVPGHEKFVRHMLAGATGVDMALLVIAADDGIMPQTIEHVAILELLGVQTCVVALTKVDLVDNDWRNLVIDEINNFLASTPFADSPIIGVSTRTGEGLDKLRAAIDEAASHAKPTKNRGLTRMPIDRVFTLQGIGTVVTGTLWSGTINEGDEMIVLPEHLETRIRSIQIHGEPQSRAQAGNRVAVCLHNLSCDDVHPGDFLAAPGADALSDRFDAEFVYLDPFKTNTPLKSGSRVHVAHGTREVLGRILLMDGRQSLASGEKALVQIRPEEPLALAYRDRFIVRSYSPVHVIGGGTVLATAPRRRTNLTPEEHTMLNALDAGDIDAAASAHMELAQLPETAENIAKACGLDSEQAEQVLNHMTDETRIVPIGTNPVFYARPALIQQIMSHIDHTLLEHHSTNPNSTGIQKETLRQAVAPKASESCFDAIVQEALKRGIIVQTDGEISHPQASESARKQEQIAGSAILNALRAAADTPEDINVITEKLGLDGALAGKAVTKLAREGKIVRVEPQRYYDAEVIERYRSTIAGYIEKHGRATAAELKDAMGTTRKYAMPLLEYFDSVGLTRRVEDFRTLV